jgi:hypothetical protein
MSDKTIVEKLAEHQYAVPLYSVEEGKGIVLSGKVIDIDFVRGSIVTEENTLPKQDGVLVEQLLEVCRQHLVSVNVGQLASHETSLAITAIEEAMLRLYQREYNRKKAGTLGTYKK